MEDALMRMRWYTLLVALVTGCSEPADSTFRAVTFNIRFDNPGDGQDAWPNRSDWVAASLDSLDADIVGLQEAVAGQVADLEAALPGFGRVGVGRDDGRAGGEFSPVMYRRDRFELEDHGTIWLSETPDSAGSRGWDAALPRIATWLVLRPAGADRSVLVVNTHFDHVGVEARRNAARLLRSRFVDDRSGTPLILMGDLNVTDTTTAYRILAEDGELTDTWVRAGSRGPADTFTGFPVTDEVGPRIDYILVTDAWETTGAVALDLSRGGRHPSDHRPVVADLVLRRN